MSRNLKPLFRIKSTKKQKTKSKKKKKGYDTGSNSGTKKVGLGGVEPSVDFPDENSAYHKRHWSSRSSPFSVRTF